MVLKRLTDAVRDGDRVLAVVRGSAVNQDGRSNGLTAPNTIAQRDVITRALRSADVTAGSVNFIEAHGTGTGLGDPIEFEALAEVYGRGEVPCALGAVKSNFGHLEAAAGIAGFIKAALSVQRAQIPPNLNFSQWNPAIDPQADPAVRSHRAQPLAALRRPAAGRDVVIRPRRDERTRRDRAGPDRCRPGRRLGVAGDDADGLRQDRAADRVMGDGAGRLDNRAPMCRWPTSRTPSTCTAAATTNSPPYPRAIAAEVVAGLRALAAGQPTPGVSGLGGAAWVRHGIPVFGSGFAVGGDGSAVVGR